jgi:hypothetical protein
MALKLRRKVVNVDITQFPSWGVTEVEVFVVNNKTSIKYPGKIKSVSNVIIVEIRPHPSFDQVIFEFDQNLSYLKNKNLTLIKK